MHEPMDYDISIRINLLNIFVYLPQRGYGSFIVLRRGILDN